MNFKSMLETKLFRSRSLQAEVQRTVLGIFLILVVSYSIALGYYFTAGINIANSVGMKTVTETYQTKHENVDDREMLLSGEFTSEFDYKALPLHVQNLFEYDSITLGAPEIKLNKDAPEGSGHLIFLLAERMPDGGVMYLYKEIDAEEGQAANSIVNLDFLEHAVVVVGAIFLILVHITARIMTHRINKFIAALQVWAEELEFAETQKTHPDFRYEELNKVADRLVESAQRIGDFIERERAFLRHASHELRTPIATISGNISLMDKLNLNKQQSVVMTRIDRACHSMRNLVTTLLWLGRESHMPPQEEEFNLKELLLHIVEEHQYLLSGKQIELNFELLDINVVLPKVPLSIVLANLIRNAFQHTESGTVNCTINDDYIQIQNSASFDNSSSDIYTQDQGIGLSLTQRIVRRLGWELDIIDYGGTTNVKLYLPSIQ